MQTFWANKNFELKVNVNAFNFQSAFFLSNLCLLPEVSLKGRFKFLIGQLNVSRENYYNAYPKFGIQTQCVIIELRSLN